MECQQRHAQKPFCGYAVIIRKGEGTPFWGPFRVRSVLIAGVEPQRPPPSSHPSIHARSFPHSASHSRPAPIDPFWLPPGGLLPSWPF